MESYLQNDKSFFVIEYVTFRERET